jgi:hypothetical protein
MYNPNTKFHGVLDHEKELLPSPTVVFFGVHETNVDDGNTTN